MGLLTELFTDCYFELTLWTMTSTLDMNVNRFFGISRSLFHDDAFEMSDGISVLPRNVSKVLFMWETSLQIHRLY